MSLLANDSAEAAKILCDPDKLKNYIELPGNLLTSVQNVSSVLCGTDPGQAANTAKIIGDLLAITATVIDVSHKVKVILHAFV